MAEWWNGNRMAEMVEWRNSGIAEWRNGGMVIEWRKWWNGGMAEWRNGGTAERMAEWQNGRNGLNCYNLSFSSPNSFSFPIIFEITIQVLALPNIE